MLDRAMFLARARQAVFGGHLSDAQAGGLAAILDGWDARLPIGDLRWLAYMLATTFHETNQQMVPVREAYWLSEEWRRTHLPAYPYYGRGFVQLTHRENYRHAGGVLDVDLVAEPDLALRRDYAAVILFEGMTEGWFRVDQSNVRHALPRYFNRKADDPVGARAIINGYEPGVAERIAGHHRAFLSALRASASPDLAASLSTSPPLSFPVGEPVMTLYAAEPTGLAAPMLAVPGRAEASVPRHEGDGGRDEDRREGHQEGRHGERPREPAGGHAHPSRPHAGASEMHRLTADIVLAYLDKNAVSTEQLPEVIAGVYMSLAHAETLAHRLHPDGADAAEGGGEPGKRRSPPRRAGLGVVRKPSDDRAEDGPEARSP